MHLTAYVSELVSTYQFSVCFKHTMTNIRVIFWWWYHDWFMLQRTYNNLGSASRHSRSSKSISYTNLELGIILVTLGITSPTRAMFLFRHTCIYLAGRKLLLGFNFRYFAIAKSVYFKYHILWLSTLVFSAANSQVLSRYWYSVWLINKLINQSQNISFFNTLQGGLYKQVPKIKIH